MTRGFLVDTSFIMDSGTPLLRLYGRSEDGRPFLVREHRFRPYFFIAADCAHLAPQHEPSPLKTLLGEPVVRVSGTQPAALQQLSRALEEKGARCFESGMDDFLAKPVRTEDLQSALKKFTHAAGEGLRAAA